MLKQCMSIIIFTCSHGSILLSQMINTNNLDAFSAVEAYSKYHAAD